MGGREVRRRRAELGIIARDFFEEEIIKRYDGPYVREMFLGPRHFFQAIPVPWTHLSQTSTNGSVTLTLKLDGTWKAEDEIVIVSIGHRYSQKENEVRRIASVSSDAPSSGLTIILTEPLTYTHLDVSVTVPDGTVFEGRADVGLLTRNIVVRGSKNPKWNDQIEARRLRHSHIMDGAFFIEGGIKTSNVLQYNLTVFVNQSTSLLNDDVTPASYWVTNPNNIIWHNAAAGGTHFGFWDRMHEHPDGPSYNPNICQKKVPEEKFSNNTVHFQGFGLWIFQDYFPMKNGKCNLCGDIGFNVSSMGVIPSPPSSSDPTWNTETQTHYLDCNICLHGNCVSVGVTSLTVTATLKDFTGMEATGLEGNTTMLFDSYWTNFTDLAILISGMLSQKIIKEQSIFTPL
ncbi:LOW QUALITY PROTEIN: PKHD1 like 1, tandem duplicate 2 [Salvelinus alpinus]